MTTALARTLAMGIVALMAAAATSHAAPDGPTSKPAALEGAWGDQGDGTFVNPILPGDFSDLDAIRVGDDFYAISSTLHLSPGMAVLHSRDLVNWRIISHAVPDVSVIGPDMNWDRMNRFGKGVWAGSIRHHAGKFWIYFGAPDEGIFMTSATDPAGPWEPLHQVWKTTGWNDTCSFYDDDGQAYLIMTRFGEDPATKRKYDIHLFKLSADGRTLDESSGRFIHNSRGSEASKLYKIDGTYYHYFSEVRSEGRVPMMNRAKSLEGPWEARQIGHVNKRIDNEPNQGGLIQLPSGEWWFVTHQGTGAWQGRSMCLLPVTWRDGWPIIGEPATDGIGTMVWQAKKPIASEAPALVPLETNFDQEALSPDWSWNHQPRADKWSLTERPGFLRLSAFKPLRAGDLMRAGNTLSVGTMRTKQNEATAKLDLSGMADGQRAGLCHFSRNYAAIEVSQADGKRTIGFIENGKRDEATPLSGDSLWLRTTWGLDGQADFAFSTDGTSFTPLGRRYAMMFGHYRGDRVGLFTYNDAGEAGHVDVDSFKYVYAR